MLSINVLVVTYNQENVIGRALDSVISQKDYGLNRIIICDDCSKDNNRLILEDYEARYPDIIENHFNEANLGIYGNFNKLVSVRGDADLYLFLAGDDVLKDGWFECVQNFAVRNAITSGEEPFSIYSDWTLVRPDGAEHLCYNRMIGKFPDEALSLKMRGLICGVRSVLNSKGTLNQFAPVDVSKELSYAEELFDMQAPRFSKFNYYLPYNASVYYAGIGVSRNLGRVYLLEDEEKWGRLIVDFNLEGKDYLYARFKQECSRFYKTHRFRYFVSAAYLFLASYPKKYGHTLLLFYYFIILLKRFIGEYIRQVHLF